MLCFENYFNFQESKMPQCIKDVLFVFGEQ